MYKFAEIVAVTVALVVTVESAQLVTLSTTKSRHASSSRFKRWIGSNPLSLNSLANLATLGTVSAFRHVKGMAMTNAKGGKRVRLIQTYAGYDVFGSSVEAELDYYGYFSGQLYGQVARNLDRDIPNPDACKKDEKDVFNMAIQMEGIEPGDPMVEKGEWSRIIYLDGKRKRGRIAYKLHFFYQNEETVSQPVYFIDACSNNVLLHFDGLINSRHNPSSPHHVDGQFAESAQEPAMLYRASNNSCNVSAAGVGGNVKTGMRTYNVPPFCLNVRMVNDTTCEMVGEYSKVVDNLNSIDKSIENPVVFDCSEGYLDPVNEAFGVANDVFYFAEKFGEFLKTKYNFRIRNDIMRYAVHYGSKYENAFYNYKDFFFGDGRVLFYPFTQMGSVSHETAHAMVHLYSGLIYRTQTGGMDEAFADITSEVFEHFLNGINDWLHGWGIWKPQGALRFFENPADDGVSIKYSFQFKHGLDVHYSSGVYRHAFYRLVEKEGMDIFDAYKCFLDANLLLWSPFINFRTAACHVMQACYDNGLDHRKVRRAFFGVGISLFFCDYSALATSIHGGESLKSVLVSESRSPIFKAEVDRSGVGETVTITAETEGATIRIDVGLDDEVDPVIKTGQGEVRFGKTISPVYIKLSTDTPGDAFRVTLSFIP